jgi:hypothetical protein
MFPIKNVPGPFAMMPHRSKCEVPGTLYRLMGVYLSDGKIMRWESHSSRQHN